MNITNNEARFRSMEISCGFYLLTPTQIYDFWNEPYNTDELFDYCFPVNGWICWFCEWCYWAIENIANFILKFAMIVPDDN
jgi:hypothetical protein